MFFLNTFCSYSILIITYMHLLILWTIIAGDNNTQYDQGEGGKTELSLVAFSCRHPGWQPTERSQRQFLRSLRQSMYHALPSTNHLVSTLFLYISSNWKLDYYASLQISWFHFIIHQMIYHRISKMSFYITS